jgi:hypothetical protein
MSHPLSKRERFLIGCNKGKRRAKGLCASWRSVKENWLDRNSKRLRDMTKACNCRMCANPRKIFGEVTMQERKQNEQGALD